MSEIRVNLTTGSSVPNTPFKTSANGTLNIDRRQSLSKEDLQLLARLQEQNRILESDSKSLNMTHTHSRKSSDASLVSVQSSQSYHGMATEDEQLEEDVWVIWGRIVNDWEYHIKKKNLFVKEQVRKGIPHHFRGIAWQLLCNAQNCPAKHQYAEYMKNSSPCEKVIRRDIARTYPEHEFFKEKDGPGQESLFNVMKAYSLHDREVGYCQGSAFIVGLLLLQMPEEETFAVLTRLMEDYRLREMYKPSMAELGLCMYQLESIVQELIPELHIHFQSQNFHTSMYASSWFLTLFTATLPLQLASRVMDLFLSEGMEMVFRIAVAILQSCKEDLLQLDMEGMLRYFQKEVPIKCETDPDYLVTMGLQVKYNNKKIKKLEKEYTSIKVKENEEQVEMRRLRTENRLLRQRIENLEQESSDLADRLIQGQVTRAQEAEDNFAIKRELEDLKYKEQTIKDELDVAYEQIRTLSEAGSQPPSFDNSVDELLQSLQEELVTVKLREAEKDEIMQDLRGQIQELEEANKQLRETTPDKTLAQLQEELIAVKLREAEASLSMKELRQKVSDLQAIWRHHLNEANTDSPPPSKKQEKSVIVQLQEELISAKMHEAEAMAELKDLHQKVMELESLIQVNLNQIRRQEDQVKKLQNMLGETARRENELQNRLKEEQKKYADLKSKMIVGFQLQLGAVNSEDGKHLCEYVSGLKAEVVRLETLNKKLTAAVASQAVQSPSSPASSLSKDSSLTNLNSILELAMSRSNSFCDESLSEFLHLGVDKCQLSNKDLLNKNTKVNGEATSCL